MKPYFAYIRVSTVKQGERGSSLPEQRDAILAFAARNSLSIARWFEERETAAKVGRTQFNEMLKAFRRHEAVGVIFHKIDRSARNLKDWSIIQDLSDSGIDVRFAHESINLTSSEGKLTGDFLAVIASHYIRNLREEVRKGMLGRFKQGLYPLPAPVGYLNHGGGKPKTIDPLIGPLVRLAFELYATGNYSLERLATELEAKGLKSRSGKFISTNRLSDVLRNPFYMGILSIRGRSTTFQGVHEPLIPVTLFEAVQRVLDGKLCVYKLKHGFIFRRMIGCATCKYHLIGEKQKGRVYYRCHSKTCPGTCIREDQLAETIKEKLGKIDFTETDCLEVQQTLSSLSGESAESIENYKKHVELSRAAVAARLSRLTDAFLEGLFEQSVFAEKKQQLLMERQKLDDEWKELTEGKISAETDFRLYVERLKNLTLSYEFATDDEKRDIVKTVTSNFFAKGKNVVVELRSPFREIESLKTTRFSGPFRSRPRTFAAKAASHILTYCERLEAERKKQKFGSTKA